MGNNIAKSQSSSTLHTKASMEFDVNFKKCIDDDRYGEIKVYSERSLEEDIAVKSITFNSKEPFNQMLEEGYKRMTLDLPTILRLRKISFQEETDLCSRVFKIYFAYEYISTSLVNQLARRKKRRIFFSEPEILHLIDCILSALIYFESNDINHGDLRPETIFLSKDGIYKLNDIQFMVGLTAYRRFLMGVADKCYLSPELFAHLKHRDLKPEFDYQKAEVFSLGMITLEAATLEEIDDCYDMDRFAINDVVLDKLLAKVQSSYSEVIYHLIKEMLNLDSALRPDFRSVLRSMTPNKDQYTNDGKRLETSELRSMQLEVSRYEDEKFYYKGAASVFQSPDNIDLKKSIDNLNEKVRYALKNSQTIKQKYDHYESSGSKKELLRDDVSVLSAKIDSNHKKTPPRFSPRQRNTTINEEEEGVDSSKLYELYLQEYEKLKRHQNY